jgi:hypothetical protein
MIQHMAIDRFAYLKSCTLGWMLVGNLRLATIERPWLANPKGQGGTPRESCVPDGLYDVRPHHSEKFPETFALVNPQRGVYYQPADIPSGQQWGRSAILIHAGNTADDVVGCIAVGLRHENSGALHYISDSRIALGKLRALLGRDQASLLIRPVGTQELVAA